MLRTQTFGLCTLHCLVIFLSAMTLFQNSASGSSLFKYCTHSVDPDERLEFVVSLFLSIPSLTQYQAYGTFRLLGM
jgi:hypothetical protein